MLIRRRHVCWLQRESKTFQMRNISWTTFSLRSRAFLYWKSTMSWLLIYCARFFYKLHQLLLIVFANDGFIWLEENNITPRPADTFKGNNHEHPPFIVYVNTPPALHLGFWALNIVTHPLCRAHNVLTAGFFELRRKMESIWYAGR